MGSAADDPAATLRGPGPAECCLAVAKAFERLCLEAAQAGVEVEVLEEVAGERPRTWRSLLLGLRGIAAEALGRALGRRYPVDLHQSTTGRGMREELVHRRGALRRAADQALEGEIRSRPCALPSRRTACQHH